MQQRFFNSTKTLATRTLNYELLKSRIAEMTVPGDTISYYKKYGDAFLMDFCRDHSLSYGVIGPIVRGTEQGRRSLLRSYTDEKGREKQVLSILARKLVNIIGLDPAQLFSTLPVNLAIKSKDEVAVNMMPVTHKVAVAHIEECYDIIKSAKNSKSVSTMCYKVRALKHICDHLNATNSLTSAVVIEKTGIPTPIHLQAISSLVEVCDKKNPNILEDIKISYSNFYAIACAVYDKSDLSDGDKLCVLRWAKNNSNVFKGLFLSDKVNLIKPVVEEIIKIGASLFSARYLNFTSNQVENWELNLTKDEAVALLKSVYEKIDKVITNAKDRKFSIKQLEEIKSSIKKHRKHQEVPV